MQLHQVLILFGLFALVLGDASKLQINTSPEDITNFSNSYFSNLIADHSGPLLRPHGYERRWFGPPPEPVDDAMWEAAKCKGRKFMAQMSYSDFDVGQMLPIPQTTAQSPWSFSSLSSWGYMMSGVDYVYRNFETGGYWGVADLFRHFGVSDRCRDEGGLWNAAVITHYRPGRPDVDPPTSEQTYVGPDNYVRRMTGAYFYMAVNPQGGIMVQNTLGPRQAADTTHPNNFADDELPHLQKLSDMMWALWEFSVPASQWSGINFFMSLGIINPTSKGIIRRALDSAGGQLTDQPFRFDPTSDGGLAILGSPNGARVAHFLTQRKGLIGLKTVSDIWAFECQSHSRAPCLMFSVGNLFAPVPRPQDASSAGADVPTNFNRAVEKLSLNKESVRVHTFRIDAGNVTFSSEYI